MKRLIKQLKLIFILLLFLFGCSNSVSEKVQPYFLLSENTCSFPCWMGITPGETTASEAEEMLDQLVHRYAQKGIEITYTKDFASNTYGDKDYFYYVLTPGSEIFIGLYRDDSVYEIYIVFLNTPTVSEFVANYGVPNRVGVCYTGNFVQTHLIYEGLRVLTKSVIPIYDKNTKTVAIENFYDNQVDAVFFNWWRPEVIYGFTFDWEDMAQTVVINLDEEDSNTNCFGDFIP